MQQRFGVDRPIRGSLLAGMLLESPAELPAAFGAVPMTEGDLLVRVGSEAINTAASLDEALAALDAVIPLLELPDLVLGRAVKADAGLLTAVNAGARYGVMGKPVPLAATSDWRERLGSFRLLILDGDGNTVAEGDGTALLGHPLNVVLWLRDSLAAEGRRLQSGDLLSLGSVTPLMPARPGTTVRARYLGLDPAGPVEVSVRFR